MPKNFSTYPPTFLQNISLTPHNFNNPENSKHLQYLQEDLKYNLFTFTYLKIKQIEYRKLKKKNDYFRIRKIEKKKNCDLGLIKNFFLKKYKENNSDLIICEKWYINFNDEKDFIYDIHFYHSFNDQFFSLIFPKSYFDFFYGLWKNKGL